MASAERNARMTRGGWHGAVLLALVVLVPGCGAGLTVRTRGPVPVVAAGAGAGVRAGAGAGAGAEAGAGAGAGAGAEETAGTAAEAGEEELPGLPAEGLDTVGAGAAGAPASRYASLDRARCEVELGRRNIGYERVGEARGVIAPLRLTGPIAGVNFHSMLPAAQRRTSPYEIYDCRLVLALDDWARVLARHDIVEVVHYSVYRPPPAKSVRNGPGRRHGGALAIDAAIFKTRDGRTMNVEKDFHGRIGSKPCGPRAASVAGLPTEALTLRQIVCEAADAQLFNVMLTPDYNWPHRNHFHLEVTAGVRWVLVR